MRTPFRSTQFRLLFCLACIIGPMLHGQAILVNHPIRAHINNVVWSADSKMIAYESFPVDVDAGEISIYVFSVAENMVRRLVADGSGDAFGDFSEAIKLRLPTWGKADNSLYLLYNDADNEENTFTSERLMGKMRNIEFANLPYDVADIQRIYRNIGQVDDNGNVDEISEYHIWMAANSSEEYYFIKYTQNPHLIQIPWPRHSIFALKKLQRIAGVSKTIDSFTISTDGRVLAYVVGIDNDKEIMIGAVSWNAQIDDVIKKFDPVKNIGRVTFLRLSVQKNEIGILQEPLVNPTNHTQIAYLEIIPKDESVLNNELHVIDGWTVEPATTENGLQSLIPQKNILIKSNIYRNEKNRISRPNSTSFIWHSDGSRIIYINSERHVEILSVNTQTPEPKVLFMERVSNAEQIAISPDGKQLAVLTQDKSSIGDALSEIWILDLDSLP